MADRLQVQLCYATPTQEVLLDLEVEQGTTIEQAIIQSAIPGIDLTSMPVGLFGKKRPLDTVLRERDRIEIYRPLVADPKESRRRRADKAPPHRSREGGNP